jgi:hypothetical protein
MSFGKSTAPESRRKPLPHTRARGGALASALTACHMLGRWQVLR